MFSRRLLLNLIIFFLACIAAYFLYRAVERHGVERIFRLIGALPAGRIAAALLFAAGSYLCLGFFDYFGVRYAGKPLPYRKTAIASFVGLSLGHNVGVAGLSSGTVRYHYYSRCGLTVSDTAKVIIFSAVCVAVGLSTITGIGLLLYPEQATFMDLGRRTTVLMACICIGLPWIYVLATLFIRREIQVWRWSFVLPEPRLALWQIGLGSLNFALVAGCLHQLMQGLADVRYFEVLTAYAVGQAAGLLSHVPGGLGVLEATVLYLLPGASSLGALLAFRAVYFFTPLLAGLTLFLVGEFFRSA